MKEYGCCPSGASTLSAFRKRVSEVDIAALLETIVSLKVGPDDKKKNWAGTVFSLPSFSFCQQVHYYALFGKNDKVLWKSVMQVGCE